MEGLMCTDEFPQPSRIIDGSAGHNALAGSGFQFFGQLLLQWGQVTITSSTSAVATFPTAFPTNLFQLVLTPGGTVSGGSFYWGSTSLTGFTATQANSATVEYSYIAIGN